ncbi:hypothetical protein C8Q76DRAFT_767442 [Earliella scabrosa]|nr:hypothetical protein C8Q76DRAFT_767442 [Earliella scabrosa]
MPKSVEKNIVNIIRKFMWNGDEHPRIGLDTLYRPIEEGGLGLLNVVARNEAIDLMWLKEYLQFDEMRPKWAYVADRIFAKALPCRSKSIDETAQLNVFIQTWNVSTHPAAGLPLSLKRMYTTALKYGVRVEVANPKEILKRRMPSWYHIGQQPGRYVANHAAAKCLRERHDKDREGRQTSSDA